jgi:hypothetical protein
MGSGPLWSGLLHLGQLPLCRPVRTVAAPEPHSILAPGPLGDVMASS